MKEFQQNYKLLEIGTMKILNFDWIYLMPKKLNPKILSLDQNLDLIFWTGFFVLETMAARLAIRYISYCKKKHK